MTKLEISHNVVKSDGSIPKITRLSQLLIWKFLKGVERFTPKDWARETKIANKLIKSYNCQEFWEKYPNQFPVNSLAYFLTTNGKHELYLNFNKYKLDFPPPKQYDLGDKLGEDKEIYKKPGIKEFLDLDYE